MSKKIMLLLSITLLIFSVFIANFYNVDKKYSNDYLAVDYVKTKNIISEERIATVEELAKYDVNNDGKLTEDDLLIMRCLICEVFNTYEIRNTRCKAIKYIRE